MRLRRLSKEDISETLWKWRCKAVRLFKKPDKTLSDFSASSSFDERTGGAKDGGAEDAKVDATFGATPAVKTLYGQRGRYSFDSDLIDWVDYPPKNALRSAAKGEDRVAIKVYKLLDTDKHVVSGRFPLKYSQIEIQNPQLVSMLSGILETADVHLASDDVIDIREPFGPLYFCYDDIVAAAGRLPAGDPTKEHVRLLVRVLDDIFCDVRSKKKKLLVSGLISFKLAWTYFPAGCEVLSWDDNGEFLVKVSSTKIINTIIGDKILVISARELRFNGEEFIWEDVDLEIPEFEGNKLVTDLPHYPLSFHKDAGEIRERLVTRGKKTLKYQGLAYCTYSGIGIHKDGQNVEKHNVEGRILLDTIGYNKYHLARGSREDKHPRSRKRVVRGTGRHPPDYDSPEEQSSERTKKPGTNKKRPISKRLTEEEQEKNNEAMLAKARDLAFMRPFVRGYALKNKLWMSFHVDDVRPVVWNDSAFDHLVYDEQQKDLVLSFVKNHRTTKTTVGDVIAGKGEGLIILLSGPPGTGKTLTAEAVADRTHRPLVYLQAEDLGVTALSLGTSLKRILEMATDWNAVVLLDEADVFMAERNPHDIMRNELVSIFLRELEYFRGIIFLTTNLYSTIDSAFRSRVSMHLFFNPLTVDAREKVWTKFLDLKARSATAELQAIEEVEEEGKEKKSLVNGDGETETRPTDDVRGDGRDGTSLSLSAVNGHDEQAAESSANQSLVDELSDEDLKDLAAWELNGREIANVSKMVKLWCDHNSYPMTLARLESGIRATNPHASKRSHENDTSIYDI